MARKNYTDLFRRQAVDLYRSTPGATLRGIAADLGISRHTQPISDYSIFGLATDHNGGPNVGSGAGGADDAQC
jgi:hypothetical protein